MPAAAQDDRYGNSLSSETPETVEVRAPRVERDTAKLNGPHEKVSMSGDVNAGDLDLRTPHGASELRWRVRDAAQDVCLELARIYPDRQAPGTDCYRSSMRDAVRRADTAIDDARSTP